MTIILIGFISDSVNFVAECYYKTVTFSAEDFARRLSSLGDPSEDKDKKVIGDTNNSDSDPESVSLSSTTSRSSSVCSLSSNCQVITIHQFSD